MQKTRVLLLDDSMTFRHSVETELTAKGFEIVGSSGNGDEGLRIIKEEKPDIVVTDILLAGTDGLGLIRKIKEERMMNPPIFVIASKLSSDYLMKEANSLGVGYYLLKPVDGATLSNRLMRLAGGRQNEAKREMPKVTVTFPSDLEREVTDCILDLGIPAHIKGYYYIRTAILMSIDDPSVMGAVTKILYPTVAKRYSTTPSRVERAIRHAIEVAWERGDIDKLQSFFGYTVSMNKGKPTNSEFIALIADRLRLKRAVTV